MKLVSYWNDFIGTGAVEDYLKYKNEEQPEQGCSSYSLKRKEKTDAGSDNSDGNDNQEHSCG